MVAETARHDRRRTTARRRRTVESLYPFLYAGTSDLPAVLADVRQSTVAKARRDHRAAPGHGRAGRRAAGRLRPRMARRFAARRAAVRVRQRRQRHRRGQQVATLFLHPGGGARPLPAFGLASDTAVVTALCNDIGVDVVFARQIAAFGRPRRHRHGPVDQRQLREPAARLRRGQPPRAADHRAAGYDGGKMAELDSPRLPVRGAVVVGAPDPGSADHGLPRAVGAHPGRAGPAG